MAINLLDSSQFHDSVVIYGDLIVEGNMHVHGDVRCGKDVIAYDDSNITAFENDTLKSDVKYFRSFHVSNKGVHINGRLLTNMSDIVNEIRDTMNELDDQQIITSIDQI
jgi:hypothetical protein